MSRSLTSRCLTPCRWTLWSAPTHQVITALYSCKIYQNSRELAGKICIKTMTIQIQVYRQKPSKGVPVINWMLTLVCLQICLARLQVRTGRSSTSSDQRSTSKLHPSSLLISFKSSSTRTQIYPSVSRLRADILPHFGSVCLYRCRLPFLPLQCDPALLPEPNHVMLNHLYALSIKVH